MSTKSAVRRQGRPMIYTLELCQRVIKLFKPGERNIKDALLVVAKQSHKTLKYVPFLVACGPKHHNLKIRQTIRKMKAAFKAAAKMARKVSAK